MFESQKNVFWQALLITILLFSLGVISGMILENWRTNKIDSLYEKSEIKLMDIKLQNEIYSTGNFNCKKAIEENLNFAEKIYEEAKLLERYEKASQMTDKLLVEHSKYDLLRTTLLLNSVRLKEKCNATYDNVVYFYKYNNLDLVIKEKQNVFSNLLMELKQAKGDKIMLIPIAADNDLTSINILLDKYNISQKEIPVIIINEKTKITDLQRIEELEKYLK